MPRDVERVDRDDLNLHRRELVGASATLASGALIGSTPSEVSAQDSTPKQISGQVTDANGSVENAEVVAVPHDSSLQPLVTTTDANGEYTFGEPDLYAGTELYHVIARDGDQSNPRRGQENYPFIAAEGSPAGEVSRWNFEDASNAGTLYDEWGTNNGSNNGGSYSTTAQVGTYSYDVDGSSAYGEVPHANSLNIGTVDDTFTFCFWLRPRSLGSNPISKNTEADVSTDPLLMELNSDGSVNWIVSVQGSWDRIGMGVISTGQWNHFAVVYNAGTRETYLNGSLHQSDSISNNDYSNSMPLTFGCRYDASGSRTSFYDGFFDSIRLYDRALEQSDIQYIYDQES